ncbi:MAG TPA: hypothetical protein VGF59_17460 [Bryobacteraceae bacterium]|jgi:ABC-type phosphate transport system substrate-binding protein
MRILESFPPRILLTAACVTAFLLSAGSPPPPPEATDLAIVVRPDVPVDNLTFAELRRVMLGDRQFWSSNLKVTLLVRAPGAREREVVLKTIYQMSEAQFKQYWIAKVFRAEAAGAPRIVYSNDMAAELAQSIPGAIAFVDVSQIPKGLKVLKINGVLPGQPGYPLH